MPRLERMVLSSPSDGSTSGSSLKRWLRPCTYQHVEVGALVTFGKEELGTELYRDHCRPIQDFPGIILHKQKCIADLKRGGEALSEVIVDAEGRPHGAVELFREATLR